LCFSSFTLAEQKNGQGLFKAMCSSCHSVEREDSLAPPVFGIVNHTKKAYPDREDFIERIVDWVLEPDVSQSIMPGAVKRFGLMPKLPYSESDITKIAEYLYDDKLLLPEWYKHHYKKEHGHHH
ncbi:MAG: cytochrome c, partial [Candidatus Marinimicrobia bacterium]|nr:cytochrome c [Candidatus Neomarinimicrobiota bacterium]